MNLERTFTNVDDAVLARLISQAAERVVFVAPGLRKLVADALAIALLRLPGRVTVVLDVDAEVCRLGFGDFDGLAHIKCAAEKAGARVLHQPGVRIGLLIVDGNTVRMCDRGGMREQDIEARTRSLFEYFNLPYQTE